METLPSKPYTEWTREELEDGISQVQEQIATLQYQIAAEAENHRFENMLKSARIQADIDHAKSRLRAQGVEVPSNESTPEPEIVDLPRSNKRKRKEIEEEADFKPGKRKKAKKGKRARR